MRFKNFEIKKPTIIGNPPDNDYYKYNFDIVKYNEDNSTCFSIGALRYNKREESFEFESCGLRYLEYREEGLEEFIIAWCKAMEISLRYDNVQD